MVHFEDILIPHGVREHVILQITGIRKEIVAQNTSNQSPFHIPISLDNRNLFFRFRIVPYGERNRSTSGQVATEKALDQHMVYPCVSGMNQGVGVFH